MGKTKKVIVGMSGGVDSSVAAYLLLQQGYAVEGLFMKNWEEDDGTEYCTAIEDLNAAENACTHLGIPLRTANFAAEYWDAVFAEFLAEYQAGRTPNPDVLCNREIKFKHFVDYASRLGADAIATGHYARWLRPGILGKALDANKDQTYFLQAVPIEALAKCIFPLAELQKSEVRAIAAEVGLMNHNRKDSTGICFIGERRFADFISRYIPTQQGQILDPQGRKIGTHSGAHQFTPGQRQGLHIGGLKGRAEAPWYVVAKDTQSNTVVASQSEYDLMSRWLRAEQVNWLQSVSLPVVCQAKIRYRQADQHCTVKLAADGSLLVDFAEPQRAVACGQYIAFYLDDALLGGGRITSADSQQFHQFRNHITNT